MARKASPIGPHVLALIEDARVDLARAALAVREGDNEPEFKLPEDVPDLADEEAVEAFRQALVETLSDFDRDDLRPAEQRSRRIRALAEKKGVTSLTTIVEQQLDETRSQEFHRQPDELCRSIWAYQDVVLIEDDDVDGEGALKPSATEGMVQAVGPFGEDVGKRPASDVEMFAVNAQWLHETLMRLMKPLLNKRAAQILDPDLTLVGAIQIDEADVPVYFARRLNDPKAAQRLDLMLRARGTAGVGIVFAASEELPSHLGPNVVMPLLSHLASADEEMLFARDGIELAYRDGLSLARGGVSPRVVRTGKQSGTLFIPGREPLHLAGNDQLTIFERLVVAAAKGSPDVQVKALMEGFESRSPQQAFRKETWDSIRDVYIGKGAKNGYWRLLLTAQPTEAVDEPAEEATV